jgi:hypothetical protein
MLCVAYVLLFLQNKVNFGHPTRVELLPTLQTSSLGALKLWYEHYSPSCICALFLVHGHFYHAFEPGYTIGFYHFMWYRCLFRKVRRGWIEVLWPFPLSSSCIAYLILHWTIIMFLFSLPTSKHLRVENPTQTLKLSFSPRAMPCT